MTEGKFKQPRYLGFWLTLFVAVSANASNPEYVEIQPPLPLYEYGVGAGVFSTPLYPGSEESQTRYLGLPYFIYRGRILKADDDGGVRGELLSYIDYRFDLSFSGAFSANSSDSKIRQGMPDLDWIFQMGPRFVYFFFKGREQLKLNVPIRSVLTTDFRHLKDRGFIFNPNFVYSYDHLYVDWFDFYFRFGASWATENILDYYYQVDGPNIRSDRPYFNAKAGFLMTHLDLALAFSLSTTWRLFLGYSYESYAGSPNLDSSLHQVSDSYQVGVGIVWEMYTSEERAGQWY